MRLSRKRSLERSKLKVKRARDLASTVEFVSRKELTTSCHIMILYYTPIEFMSYKPTGEVIQIGNLPSCSESDSSVNNCIQLKVYRDNCTEIPCRHRSFYRHTESDLFVISDVDICSNANILRFFQLRLTIDVKDITYNVFTIVRHLATWIDAVNVEFRAAFFYDKSQNFESVGGQFMGMKPGAIGSILDSYWSVIKGAKSGNENNLIQQKFLIRQTLKNVTGSVKLELPENSVTTAIHIGKFLAQFCARHRNLPRKAHILSFLTDTVKNGVYFCSRKPSPVKIQISVKSERFSIKFGCEAERF